MSFIEEKHQRNSVEVKIEAINKAKIVYDGVNDVQLYATHEFVPTSVQN